MRKGLAGIIPDDDFDAGMTSPDGHVRHALQAVLEGDWRGAGRRQAHAIAGRLWRCTDTPPGDMAAGLLEIAVVLGHGAVVRAGGRRLIDFERLERTATRLQAIARRLADG
jgi:hypothetical protein